jgi:hypothetical protein
MRAGDDRSSPPDRRFAIRRHCRLLSHQAREMRQHQNIPRPWSMITVFPVKYRSRAHHSSGTRRRSACRRAQEVGPAGAAWLSVEDTPGAERAIGSPGRTNKRADHNRVAAGRVHLAEKGLVRSNARQLGCRRVHKRRVHLKCSRRKFSRCHHQRLHCRRTVAQR